ncbi:SPFH domain-containing protein [Parvibium lacunae]|uniref:SPFH domain-containing protein n=1 Tax=Parvibium lacunae TaxID=1888893 RepID=A0A368KYQ7_9BURK|nr:SPFH domain-containing protein [Parvibium lacunae]RCS56550.1 SPFH domain-containing protein [Parvibium lacunae]
MSSLSKHKLWLALVFSWVVAGCTRIETGEVGLRIGLDKQIAGTELLPGSFNQTLIGSVLTFPVREIAVKLDNKTPLTLDNSTLADFDLTLVYSINPSSVSDLWATKSRSFHAFEDKSQDWYLMYNYVETIVNNAAYKAVREYRALEVADNRAKLEQEIKRIVSETLIAEKLQTALSVSLVQVRNVLPAQEIIRSANEVVTAQNALRAKEIEVKTAQQEALRIAALNANSKAIEYMNAQAQMKIAEAVQQGRVNTIIIPYDFKGIVDTRQATK